MADVRRVLDTNLMGAVHCRTAVESHIPMGRAGSPDEIAAAFAFLAADDAVYITGQTVFARGVLALYGNF